MFARPTGVGVVSDRSRSNVARGDRQSLPSGSGRARNLGNQARLRQLVRNASAPVIRRKLVVGATSDPLEHEADRVADRVMRMPQAGQAPTRLDRKCAECEKEDALHMTPSAEGAAKDSARVSAPVESAIRALAGRGQPLPDGVRSFMEPRLGHDFVPVRIHTGAHAEQLANAVSARAFTVGRDIVFGAGHYSPQSEGGRHLIAHELTHVVQQSRGRDAGAAQIRRADAGTATEEPRDAGAPGGAGGEADNPASEIEWTNQGPTASVAGATTPTTTSAAITLETGNTGASPLNNLVHQQVCALTGSESGKECFSFAATGLQAPQFSSTWLGWSSYVTGAVIKGEVYNPRPVPSATIVDTRSPTAVQAANWLRYMRGTRLGLNDGYSVARHNCRMFSQLEFADAPSHW